MLVEALAFIDQITRRSDDDHRPSVAQRLQVQALMASGGRILLVDDADDLRDLYQTALTHEGYDVRAASQAEEALDIVRTWRPDLVITDLFMPGIGGLELITRLRSDFTPPCPPIVAVSGFTDAKAEALRRGASRFETKPLSYEELLQVVDDAFAHEREPRVRPQSLLGERRAATRAIGEATLSRHLTEDPDFFDRMSHMPQVASRFFNGISLVLFFLRAGKLRVMATSNPAFPLDADAADILPIVNDVVEGAGNLVVTDGASRWLEQYQGSRDIRFLVAVPFLVDRAVVGALCLVDRTPHHFSGAAVGILEHLARRGSAVLKGGPRVVDDSGLLDHDAFSAMLRGSVMVAQEAGHTLGYAIFEVAQVPGDGSLTQVLRNLSAPSLMVGVLGRHHLAAFATADSIELVKERLELARRQIESCITVTHLAELTYDDPVPRMEPDGFAARGRELLARGVAEGRRFLAIDAHRR